MAPPATQARLKHLEKAAYLCALSAPQTSSYLQSQYDQLLSESGIPPPPKRRGEVCGGCGTIMLPGITAEVVRDVGKSGTGMPKPPDHKIGVKSNSKTKDRAHTCYKCSTRTKFIVAQKPSKSNVAALNVNSRTSRTKGIDGAVKGAGKSARSTSVRASSVTNTTDPKDKSAAAARNKSSKSRAKARKKAGLQNLIESSKRDTAAVAAAHSHAGFGLNFTDILKKS